MKYFLTLLHPRGVKVVNQMKLHKVHVASGSNSSMVHMFKYQLFISRTWIARILADVRVYTSILDRAAPPSSSCFHDGL